MAAGAGPRVAVVGAGGHAKVVIGTLLAGGYEVSLLLDDDPGKVGVTLLGIPVAGTPDPWLASAACPAIVAVGDNERRRAIVARFPGVTWAVAVHPGALVHPSVRLGPGTVVFAGAVIQPDAIVGAHAIVNTGATVDHDCVLGDFVHLAPGVHLSGGVRIGEGSLLGIGSSVKPGVEVGRWATVGAGAAVVSRIGDGVVAVGVPARPRVEAKR